jgi:hypothetical protein
MRDELQFLKGNENQLRLLSHYASAGAADRETWQDRVMELEGADRQGLVKLHGLLLAYGWIEQNTGSVLLPQKDVVRHCYRITGAGFRALKKATVTDGGDADDVAA